MIKIYILFGKKCVYSTLFLLLFTIQYGMGQNLKCFAYSENIMDAELNLTFCASDSFKASEEPKIVFNKVEYLNAIF